jgi:hyperosmotically inducible protein
MQIPRLMMHAAVVAALTGLNFPVNAQSSNDPAAETQRRSVGQTIDDVTITAKVKNALVGDDLVKARNINVDTRRGVVSLNGVVASDAEKDRAASLARQVNGVREVENHLTLSSASTGSSSER